MCAMPYLGGGVGLTKGNSTTPDRLPATVRGQLPGDLLISSVARMNVNACTST